MRRCGQELSCASNLERMMRRGAASCCTAVSFPAGNWLYTTRCSYTLPYHKTEVLLVGKGWSGIYIYIILILVGNTNSNTTAPLRR